MNLLVCCLCFALVVAHMRGSPLIDQTPILLDVPRFEQPDDVTCGPTCLTQVYRYYGYEKALSQVIRETPRNPDGGTLAVYLGISALQNGFRATLYSYDLRVFDPTWQTLKPSALIEKLQKRVRVVESKRLQRTLHAYITYLRMGGQVHFQELEKNSWCRFWPEAIPS
jgi:hypothetical protein